MEQANFVTWFREASPYIHAHRGKTFVICLDGAAVESTELRWLAHDIATLHSLGIRLVVIHGTRPQIDRCLEHAGLPIRFELGMRITSEEAMPCVKRACGEALATLQAALSTALAKPVAALAAYNRSAAGNAAASSGQRAGIRIVSGNFITAQPIGVREGIDFGYTGDVRNVDAAGIQRLLDEGYLVLLSPLGHSLTGECFNLTVEEVATDVAKALRADKWICLSEAAGGVTDEHGQPLHELLLPQARHLRDTAANDFLRRQMRFAVQACEGGVQRVHVLDRRQDGALLLELFSRDGVGALVSQDPFDSIRQADIQDVGGILELIAPLEHKGILARRSREKLEREIATFTVQERDNTIIACAALYPYPALGMAELACMAIHPRYRGEGRGGTLLAYMEHLARQMGIARLFVLTTHTAHWFRDRGFQPASTEALPQEKQQLYNYQRNSKVFIKSL